MCGIAGLWDPQSSRSEAKTSQLLTAITDSLIHRGPDSGGAWFDHEAGLSLGHRRLSIVDLSVEGNQPMASASGRYVIVTNGEIYNHLELRHELEAAGVQFRGHSDTEVMIEMIDRLGCFAATQRMAGMFAFALWDKKERCLTLGRDRLGKKPLYVGWAGQAVMFASELKAFAKHPDFQSDVDRKALQQCLKRQFIEAPRTIWQGVYKLPAGYLLRLNEDDLDRAAGHHLLARAEPYWNLSEIAVAKTRERTAPSVGKDEAVDQLDAILGLAVKERMMADVPVGAFLSGGIDSSLIVAMMQKQSSTPVKTFTASFGDKEFDEAGYAREVSDQLKTDHYEVNITPEIALSVIPKLAEIYDEPFADPSQIPFFHIAQFAKQRVTVCLSGDGGDESFAGYGRYFMAEKLDKNMKRIPTPIRRGLAGLMTKMPPSRLDHLLGKIPLPDSFALRGKLTGDRVHKMAGLMTPGSSDELYRQMTSLTVLPPDVVQGVEADHSPHDRQLAGDGIEDLMHRMMLCDSLEYLPDDVLVKVDRASMAVSLEARSPLLDHRVVEFAWTLPRNYLVNDGQGKWPLRQLLQRYLPGTLIGRSKRGFGVPIATWLRGPLRDWAEDLLSVERISREGFLDTNAVRNLWQMHLSGERDWSATLWAVLMFQAWHQRWCGNETAMAIGTDSNAMIDNFRAAS